MNISHAGLILILFFLLITYIISAYEKINGWKSTQENFKLMYAKTLIGKAIIPIITFIIAFEIIIVTLAALGIWDIIYAEDFEIARSTFLGSSILCLIFLIGLRMIDDYKGASRVGIYFLISIFGLYWLESIISIT
ncbi:hypothetical protein AAU57_02790 [Nonlabens sp. YIK11]|uniref:hypothetical protein n=1 Tax=Nonlabens sp. YIK11 TaxID=1453349 RepID=UPI0006DC09C4|nr:hypothetical protein [Nonlabens sp. YIK11]KQC32375.1 hypothetical protein AAU57_02790 [Nonlabens sp. YIK11]